MAADCLPLPSSNSGSGPNSNPGLSSNSSPSLHLRQNLDVPKFAFLIHPLGMYDVVRYAPKAKGKREALVAKILEWMPPYETSVIRGVRSPSTLQEIVGHFVTIPMLPRQFLELERQWVLDKVISGALLAQELGAQIVGLGGYNSVIGEAGRTIANRLDAAVTSGNSYTVATALQATLAAANIMEIDLNRAKVAIVGATGSIGSVCARIIAKDISHLTLVARSKTRLQALAEKIHNEHHKTAVDIKLEVDQALREADIVITASASGGNIIQPEFLKRGSVVCDVALPHDVSREVAIARPDVLVLEGGVVEVPGEVDFAFNFGYPPGMALACMAETMILTLERRFEDYSIGRGLEFERVEEIARLAKRHGFKPTGFRAFDEPISSEKIEQVKTLAKEKRRQFFVLDGHSEPNCPDCPSAES